MEFQMKYTDEQENFREEVQAFLEENVPKELVQSPDLEYFTLEQYQMIRKLGLKLGERGWLFPSWPKEYGGGSLPMDLAIILQEEMNKHDLDLPPYFGAGSGGKLILIHGTEEQKRFFLPHICAGDWIIPQAFTEPQGGSDAANVRVTAIRDGDDYIVNGQKAFISDNGFYDHDYLWTSVCTDPHGPRHQNLSTMMIPANLPGITMRPMDILEYLGGPRRANEIWFDNVRVPAFYLIGGENNGWRVMSTTLEMEHGAIGRLGRDRIVGRFIAYCKETKLNGQPLSKDPDVRDRMVDIYIDAEINRFIVLRNLWMGYTERQRSYEGSQLQYVTKMCGPRIAKNMQACLGYFALTRDPEWTAAERWIEAYMRHAVVNLHPGGTADIHKGIIARRLGIGRTVKEEAPTILQPV